MEDENGKEKESEKTENFPRSLFIHDPWPVIRDILERRFDEMWNNATPVDMNTIYDTSNEEKGDKRVIKED